ncbi:nodulation protein NfeD [Chlorobaculum sp. MV4-Y]|uniref:NfeD family protein n=1 Tax=Chlorobaculum sp. MV4-Y TaxID=2976335 RepID=UPI0021AFE0CA|nr:nodulation protein NfeD [Chlorobaculum sp. MV4-Y]UWX56903.1 nodulation protein NfeD [Chlorobaculum sp. MV4-Y]
MMTRFLKFSVMPLLAVMMFVAITPVRGESVQIRSMSLKGSVNPGSAAYFLRVLDEVNRENGTLLLVELDTPGGLVASLRQMVQGVMASRVPVVVYVAPSGAQAASAGALLLLSSHVAVMAPGTETGAAHPVDISGGGEKESVMGKKIENDLAAFARSLAQKRGRSPEWAERAVRESIASTASEALAAGVIDTVAANRKELLAFLDGRRVQTTADEVTIHTENVPVKEAAPTFGEEVMMTIANPNIAYFLLLLGLVGLWFELSTPGAIIPGVAGAIALVLGAWAMQLLSVNVTGLLLILLAILFFGLEIFVVSSGALAIAGLVALFIGSVMVFNQPEIGLVINWWVFLPLFLSFSATVLLLVFVVLRSTRKKVLSGMEGLVGETGTVERAIGEGKDGKVFVHGELWDASASGPVSAGARVEVTRVEGMKLNVKQINREG